MDIYEKFILKKKSYIFIIIHNDILSELRKNNDLSLKKIDGLFDIL
jgi:hypothetical protein